LWFRLSPLAPAPMFHIAEGTHVRLVLGLNVPRLGRAWRLGDEIVSFVCVSFNNPHPTSHQASDKVELSPRMAWHAGAMMWMCSGKKRKVKGATRTRAGNACCAGPLAASRDQNIGVEREASTRLKPRVLLWALE